MTRRQDEEGEDMSGTNVRVCSEVEEAVYLLTKRDAVHFDRAALVWRCSVPAKALIRTRFGEVVCLVLRSHDGTVVCSHSCGTVYLSGRNVVEDREGSFVDVGMLASAGAGDADGGGDTCEPNVAFERQRRMVSTKVDTLDLRGSQIDRGVISQLCRGLTSNIFVTTLSLSGNHLQDSDMALLANALVHNNYLVDLTLSYNVIAELGSTLLATALATNSHLQILDLTHNRIGKDGITPWLGPTMRANHSLRELKLSHNAIGDSRAVELLESLSPKLLTEEQQLKARIANRRRNTTIQDVKALSNDDEPFNSTLTTLLLSDAGISDEAAPYLEHVLAHTRSLTHLDLSCNAFTSTGGVAIARGLQQNATLRYLNYRDNKVEELAAVALLSALAAHNFVGTALFQDCFVGESAVGTALSQLTRTSRTLATLDLSHCPLEPPGVVEFYHALAENTSLRNVDLTNSGLKSDSAAGILAKSLQRNTALDFVNLSYNEITLRGCKLLRDGVAARGENAARLVLSLEGNSGEKCPTGTVITGGMRPARPPLIH